MADIAFAKEVLLVESAAIKNLIDRLDHNFQKAIDLIFNCKGRVVVTGIGKAGLLARKFLQHWPAPGRLPIGFTHQKQDTATLGGSLRRTSSWRFPTAAKQRLLHSCLFVKQMGAKVIAITGNSKSSLAQHSDVVLDIGKIEEPCPLGLAPSASSTAMLALGDALALTIFKKRNLSKEDYAFYHPGGELGRKLLTVEMVMRKNEANPVTTEDTPLLDVISIMTKTSGKPGAVSVVDKHNKLVGFFLLTAT